MRKHFIGNILELSEIHTENHLQIGRLSCFANAELFQEHFPKNPILPGAVITGAMKKFAELFFEAKALKTIFKAIEKISFLKPIRPNEIISIKAEFFTKIENEIKMVFSLKEASSSTHEYTRGVLVYQTQGKTI